MKLSLPLLVSVLLLTSPPASAADLVGLGSVTFPTSATGAAQDHFLRGVTILHSFGWKQARLEFQAAQEIDPDFAMAYWGESLCYNHPLIAEQDRDAAVAALERLGETPEARLAKAPTAREKGFLGAVEALFLGDGDTVARRRSYMEAMRALYEAHPADDEVAAFYALSLLMTAGAGDDAERNNVLAGAIAMQLMHRNPNHPGAAHYTIHAFDDPVHAPLALPAAYVFAEIAEKVSHARHMPSHIFIQRGMWDRVSSSNQSAYEAAVDLYEPGDSLGDMVHSLDWGQYGDLQRGDYDRAALWIERMQGIADRVGETPMALRMLAQVRARAAIERERWQPLPVTDETAAAELLATGLGAVNTGEADLAEQARQRLAALADEADEGDGSYYARSGKPLRIMALEVGGALQISRGFTDEGLAMLRESVEVAETMRPPVGAPNPLKPAHELFGEALLASGKAADAAAMFEKSLRRTPNRPLSLRGLARARAALGEHDAARALFARLSDGWRGRDVAWRQEAADFLAQGSGAE